MHVTATTTPMQRAGYLDEGYYGCSLLGEEDDLRCDFEWRR
jgi:hypothetical protein